MSQAAVKYVQNALQAVGLYGAPVDGLWGPKSQAAFDAAMRHVPGVAAAPAPTQAGAPLPWGAKVSAEFRRRVAILADSLRMPAGGAAWLMGCMAWESGETFSASVRNMAGSGAVGLIQFMPTTAAGLGTSTGALAAMTPEQQLEYVHAYFKPYAGRLNNLGDVYMAILWPAGIGKPDDWVLWDRASRPTTYRQNAGLDVNADGTITRGECVAKVAAKLEKGYLPGNVG